jgi:tRNA nucleotidyltransferase (CCA-adding enzyme)
MERGRKIGEFRGQEPDPSSAVDVRRWMAKVGEAVDDLVTIAVAEGSGADLDEAVEAVRNSAAPLTIGDLAVDGTDLMGIGVAQGPALGQLLADLLDEVLVDPTLNTKPRLLERATAMKPAG